MSTSKIKIFIVDDHPLMRQALKASIQTEADMAVVGMATDGVEAIASVPVSMPDIVMMDLMMPNMSGFEAIRVLSKIYPAGAILALSSLEDEESIFEAVQAGVRGYITKDAEHETLLEAIRSMSRGKPYLPFEIMEKLMGGVRQSAVKEKLPDTNFTSLTKREKEMLTLLGKGYSNAKISVDMEISASTVRVYLHQVMKKMGFEDRGEAVRFAVGLAVEI